MFCPLGLMKVDQSSGAVPVVLCRGQRPAEAEGHAVRPDDEVKMEAEDGGEAQQHQAETLQSTGHVLIPGQTGPDGSRRGGPAPDLELCSS